jgi:hypothetical protein
LSLQIDNTGGWPLTVSDISSSDPAFVPQTTTAVIAPGAFATVNVDFTPASVASFSGTLTITSDDPDEPTVQVTLSGAGVEPEIDLPVASLDFGEVMIGTTATASLQIHNVGGWPLTVSAISSGDPFAPQPPPPPDVIIPAGGSAQVDVDFTPTLLGPAGGTLTITSDDPDEPTVAVALSGVGVAPDIAAPPNLEFGDREVGVPVTAQVGILNLGDATLDVTDISSDDPAFVPQQTSAAVPPGGDFVFDVIFTPGVTAPFSGALTITSNDPDEPTVAVPLSGAGVATPFVTDIFLNPTSLKIGLGGTPGPLRALYLFSDGTVQLATSAAGNLPAFSSSDPGVAVVTSSGSISTTGVGTATLTATFDGVSANATIEVGPASATERIEVSPDDLLTVVVGQSVELFMFELDSGFQLGNSLQVIEDSSGSVLSIDFVSPAGNALVASIRGVAAGQADLTIRSLDDLNVERVIRVHVVSLSSLVVSPSTLTTPAARVAALQAIGSHSDATYAFTLPRPDLSWATDAPAVAPVFPNGKLVGFAPGFATVSASDGGVQASISVTVVNPTGAPQVALSGLRGEDIVGGGINMGAAAYSFKNNLGVTDVPQVDKVFVIENDAAATAPLEIAFVQTSTDRLVASGPTASLAAGRIGPLHVRVTLPTSVLGSNPPDTGPTSGTVTVFTNDLANHQIDIPVSWTWQEEAGTSLADASVSEMFFDFGDIPQGESHDRTFNVDVFESGPNGEVLGVTTTGSAFSLRTPNPNPYLADSFPLEQDDEFIPLTFTIRSTPNASSGTFQGIVSFQTDDVDEQVIEALVVAQGAAPIVPVLPADLSAAFSDETSLFTVDGSELVLVSVDSAADGFESDESTGVAYMYSTSAFGSDPGRSTNEFDAYLFKVSPGAKPEIISTDLSDTADSFAVDFGPGPGDDLAYVLTESATGTDLVRISESGNITIITAVDTFDGELVTDNAGNIYASTVEQPVGRAITKYSPAGTVLLTFPNSDTVVDMEVAGDVIHADTGVQYDTSGNAIGSFTPVPNLWFAVDSLGNMLFGDDSAGTSDPQALTLELPDGITLLPAGELPRRAEQADF